MHSIDLKNFNIRTDLLVDNDYYKNEKLDDIKKVYKIDNIKIEEIILNDNNSKYFNKKPGIYETISFEDITDKDNFKKVEDVFIKVFKEFLIKLDVIDKEKVLIIGLGNEKSTPDALGPLAIDNILVTRHLFKIGEVEEGYKNTSAFKPGVTAETGVETKDMITNLVKIIEPDFIIIIDALASSSIDRLNKTIQITSSGITPGSGVGNNREEISSDTMKVPVIAIGIPTVVDATTIVNDTFNYLVKQISYKIDNINNKKLKLVPERNQNYKDHNKNLSKEEKEKLLGMLGTLTESEFKNLIYEVLIPINENLMVTPKEVDFLIEKLSLLLSSGINKTLHKQFNPTN